MDSQAEGSKQPKKKNKLVAQDLIPKRFGVNYNPPMVILEFMVKGKLYLKKFKLFKLKANTSTEIALKYLKMRYPDFFDFKKFTDEQMCRLIDRIKQHLKKEADDRRKTADESISKQSADPKTDTNFSKKALPRHEVSVIDETEPRRGPHIVKANNFIPKKEDKQQYSEDSSEEDSKRRLQGRDEDDFEDNFDEIEDFEDEK